MNSQEHNNIEDEGIYGGIPEYSPISNEEIKCPSCLKPIKDGKCQNVQCTYFQTELAAYGLLPKPDLAKIEPVEFVDESENKIETPAVDLDPVRQFILEQAKQYGAETIEQVLALPDHIKGPIFEKASMLEK